MREREKKREKERETDRDRDRERQRKRSFLSRGIMITTKDNNYIHRKEYQLTIIRQGL